MRYKFVKVLDVWQVPPQDPLVAIDAWPASENLYDIGGCKRRDGRRMERKFCARETSWWQRRKSW
jgi:hypothetical protein